MEKNHQEKPTASMARIFLFLCLTLISCILIAATVALLVSIPDISIAEPQNDLAPWLDTWLLVTAVVVPCTFVIVLVTKTRRHR